MQRLNEDRKATLKIREISSRGMPVKEFFFSPHRRKAKIYLQKHIQKAKFSQIYDLLHVPKVIREIR